MKTSWKRGDIALAKTNTAGIDGISDAVVEIVADASTGPECYIHTGMRKSQCWFFHDADLVLLLRERKL